MKDYSGTMEEPQVQENDTSNKTENSISPEAPLKHPLEHSWTLWFYENDRKRTWLENLHTVYTFNTVEDFWCLFNHITPVAELSHGNDYSLFKQGMQPTWEDEKNHNGGRWLVSVEGRQKQSLNEMWLNLILFMIGESFDEYSDEICGAYINIRSKADKIALWTANDNKLKDIEAIGKKLKEECLHLPKDYQITYESHKENQSKAGPRAKYIMTL